MTSEDRRVQTPPHRRSSLGLLALAVATAAALVATGFPSPAQGAAPAGSGARFGRSCTNASKLATWSTSRLAAQTLAVATEEDDVSSVTHEVSIGIGGVILFGSVAPFDLGSQLAAL